MVKWGSLAKSERIHLKAQESAVLTNSAQIEYFTRDGRWEILDHDYGKWINDICR